MKIKFYQNKRFLVFTTVILLVTHTAWSQYALYIYDVTNNTNRQLTHTSNASVYNATWSNNGKKIAHDLVGAPAFPFNQAIFITDVATGASVPLPGAEGGNDPSWSPNSAFIAFDAWEFNYTYWTTTKNIYTLPHNGGTKTLVRQNSGHASWSPNSNRIAFADDWFGYIGTVNLDGSDEKFVTYGSWPSWSPNGQYIAYNGWGGGIWVIEVDSIGTPVSVPVQLSTSGYGPTWKNNSKEIVYIDWPYGDPDLYTVSLLGGVPSRVYGQEGGFEKGDYDPSYSNNGQLIAYSSFTQNSSTIPQVVTAVRAKSGDVQLETNKLQNFPNPFRHQTSLSFTMAQPAHVVLQIFNAAGQKVRTLIDAYHQQGTQTTTWDGKDNNGRPVASGVYFAWLQAGNQVHTTVMNRLR